MQLKKTCFEPRPLEGRTPIHRSGPATMTYRARSVLPVKDAAFRRSTP